MKSLITVIFASLLLASSNLSANSIATDTLSTKNNSQQSVQTIEDNKPTGSPLKDTENTFKIASIYPYPATTELNVVLNNKIRQAKVSILNSRGQVVETFGINQVQEFKIELSLNPGQYLLLIDSGVNIRSHKLSIL